MDEKAAVAQFHDWVSYIPEFLKDLGSLVGDEMNNRLDLSLESLDILERWILDRYGDTDEMLPAAEAPTVNLLACYIGETLRMSLGAEKGPLRGA